MTSKEKKPPLTPETTFCPNFDCAARGQIGQGNIGVHSQKDRRYLCRECGQTFSATTGTPFYRSRKGADLITLVVKLLSHGCPIQAIVFAFGLALLYVSQTTALSVAGYDVQKRAALRDELLRQNALLEVQVARLDSPARIAAGAQRLGMVHARYVPVIPAQQPLIAKR